MILIKNSRFMLRTVRREDASDIAKYINDKTISKNTATIPYPYALKDAQKWVNKNLSNQKKKDPDGYSFIIEIDGEVGGSIGIHRILKNHKGEIGYWLARKHWGKGIMSEVVGIVTNFGFIKLKLKRIYAGVYPYNPASMKVLEKCGYKFEGVLKKDVIKKGKFIDKHIFAKVK